MSPLISSARLYPAPGLMPRRYEYPSSAACASSLVTSSFLGLLIWSFPKSHAVLFVGPMASQASTDASLLRRPASDTFSGRDFFDCSGELRDRSVHFRDRFRTRI